MRTTSIGTACMASLLQTACGEWCGAAGGALKQLSSWTKTFGFCIGQHVHMFPLRFPFSPRGEGWESGKEEEEEECKVRLNFWSHWRAGSSKNLTRDKHDAARAGAPRRVAMAMRTRAAKRWASFGVSVAPQESVHDYVSRGVLSSLHAVCIVIKITRTGYHRNR